MVRTISYKILVKDIMTKRVITISPDKTVYDAARKMARARVGTIIIVQNGKPIGIITESDIIKKVVAKNLKPSDIRVTEIMSSPVIYVNADDDIEKVKDIMRKYRVRRLPVIQQGKLAGIITTTDIARLQPEIFNLVKPRVIEEVKGEPVSGICERCYNYSDDLRFVNGQWLCRECREELGITS